MFPRGNPARQLSQADASLALFLNVPNHRELPHGWVRLVSFTLTLENQLDRSQDCTKGA